MTIKRTYWKHGGPGYRSGLFTVNKASRVVDWMVNVRSRVLQSSHPTRASLLLFFGWKVVG